MKIPQSFSKYVLYSWHFKCVSDKLMTCRFINRKQEAYESFIILNAIISLSRKCIGHRKGFSYYTFLAFKSSFLETFRNIFMDRTVKSLCLIKVSEKYFDTRFLFQLCRIIHKIVTIIMYWIHQFCIKLAVNFWVSAIFQINLMIRKSPKIYSLAHFLSFS